MSVNKVQVPGFGFGQTFGNPITVAVAQTSTLTLTSSAGTNTYGGQWYMLGGVAGVTLIAQSTSNGVTGTWTILPAAQTGIVVMDNASFAIVNTTTSVNITLIPLN